MITITHFIPLIGPFIMGSKKIQNVKNEYVLSLTPFKNNEQHISANYSDVSVQYLDENNEEMANYVKSEYTTDNTVYKNCVKCNNIQPTDIQLSVPPCAGLSMLNAGNRGSDNAANRWMYETVKWFVAQGSKVLVFENAPGFVGNAGLGVMKNIQKLLEDLGVASEYKMNVTKTNTVMHGIPQSRLRCFFYLYKASENFVFRNIKHETPTLEAFLTYPEAEDPSIDHVIVPGYGKQETDFITAKGEWGFFRDLLKNTNPDEPHARVGCMEQWINKYKADKSYLDGYPKKAKECDRIIGKLDKGMGYWNGAPNFIRGRTNAIIAKNAGNTIHPVYNRLLTIRELMALMGYDDSFKLVDPIRNLNHICQSLPVCTGIDHIKWAIGIVTGDEQYIARTVKINEKILLLNNTAGDIENTLSVGNFDDWKPYKEQRKESKLKSFSK